MQSHSQSFCAQCAIAAFCKPIEPDSTEHSVMGEFRPPHQTIFAGQSLFRQGEAFTELFGIRSGCFKTTVVSEDGREHIINFHLPGELIGFDAIYAATYRSDAIALCESIVCALPFTDLLKVASSVPALQWRLLTIMSREVLYSSALAGNCTASERFAAFLVSLSARYAALNLPPTEFVLPMSREDIANHLRLTPETISRLFRRFHSDELLSVDQRQIRILEPEKLRQQTGPLYRWPTERSN